MAQASDRPEQLLDLIGRVYDAALDERLWAGLASQIGAAFASPGTVVFTLGNGPAEYLSATANHQIMRHAYEEYYHKVDPFAKAAFNLKPYETFASHEILSDSEYIKTELYQDFCRNVEVFHVLGSLAPIGDSKFVAIGIHRPRNYLAFDEKDKRIATLFMPHLERALQVRRRLAESGIPMRAAFESLHRVGTATLVVTRDSRIIYANDQAERLLRAKNGLSGYNQRLGAENRDASRTLVALVQSAVDVAAGLAASAGGALAIEREGRLPLTVLVAPLRPARDRFGASLPAAIVFIRDPEWPTPMTLALQGLFGLTPTEACIASMLADGRSVDDIATQKGNTPNTIRVHLKSIFAKTNTARQAQLVALILRSVAVLNAPEQPICVMSRT
jgi:DNA-binding CsgD family transcriptional regulator